MVVGMIVALLTAGTAQASFIATFEQQGSNVVGTGSGTLNLTELTYAGSAVESA